MSTNRIDFAWYWLELTSEANWEFIKAFLHIWEGLRNTIVFIWILNLFMASRQSAPNSGELARRLVYGSISSTWISSWEYAPTVVIKALSGAGQEFILLHIFSPYFLSVKEGNCIARKKY